MLALLDTLLIMLMRLCRLNRVVLRNLDDLMNPYDDDSCQTTSLMAYRRRRTRSSKKGAYAGRSDLKVRGKPLSPKRSRMP